MPETIARAITTIVAAPARVHDAIVRADMVTSYFPDRSSGDLLAGTEVTWEFDHADSKVTLNVSDVEDHPSGWSSTGMPPVLA